jgi:phenylalanyl-tRNA synthetase alpha chain
MNQENIAASNFIGMMLEVQQQALESISASSLPVDQLRLTLLGGKSELSKLTKKIRFVPKEDRAQAGAVVNQVKRSIEDALSGYFEKGGAEKTQNSIDLTLPGIPPTQGHLHIVSQAITEITRIFERIGFTRVRHPEVDWEWYAFESLNMPANHPARDEWETFFIQNPSHCHSREGGNRSHLKTQIPDQVGDDRKKNKIVLTPHTSNGQVREMEKGKLPIRMINIAKCYRRQIDVSHTPMFHQFEGLYVDRDVSITHLKGVLDYFAKQFFGAERQTRIRPFHFQFTEPSFEVDISCGVCAGKGCKLCKEGWLELGGAGMVHPNVLRNGGIDTSKYNGFAFGWGIERTYMMKAGTRLDDIRLLYSNDVRFLEQF